VARLRLVGAACAGARIGQIGEGCAARSVKI
jgi:hypothetical protein